MLKTEKSFNQVATNLSIDDIIDTGNCSTAEILVLKNIKFREVEKQVLEVHKNKISQKGGTGRNAGYYRTKITVGGVRKDLYGKDYQDIIYKLNEFYTNERAKTFESIYNMLEESDRLSGLSYITIKKKRYALNNMKDLWQLNIESITTDDILKWLNGYLQQKPLKDALNRHLRLINSIFKFAMKKGYCNTNPALFIESKDYYKYCSPDRKTNEERFFSSEEEQAIVDDIYKGKIGVYDLMELFSKETGCRVGEICGVHKTDIGDEFIHIHRQLVKGENGYIEKPYTKNERLNPNGGRMIPISKELKKVLEKALELPGDSEYLFHVKDKHCKTDSYLQHLRNRCTKLGIKTTNNHAFRISYNATLIDAGLSSRDRALLLGHTVQVNESRYSVSDKRRLERIKDTLQKREVI